jgi:hypothetical protein
LAKNSEERRIFIPGRDCDRRKGGSESEGAIKIPVNIPAETHTRIIKFTNARVEVSSTYYDSFKTVINVHKKKLRSRI